MHITGKNRLQMEMLCMEDRIGADNPVRVIDAFIDALDLKKLGFADRIEEYICDETPVPPSSVTNQGGRPSYTANDLLKIYIYGYYNRIRSSRLLERECIRNIGLHWLVCGINPKKLMKFISRKAHSIVQSVPVPSEKAGLLTTNPKLLTISRIYATVVRYCTKYFFDFYRFQ